MSATQEQGGDGQNAAIVVPQNLSTPDIRSVSAGTSLGVELNLKDIAMRVRNTEYNPKRFNAVYMRLREPRATAVIFRTGKLNVMGAQSVEAVAIAIRKFAKKIRKLGYTEAKVSAINIHNILATFAVPFLIRLETIARSHFQFCTFEPELFPALIYRMLSPKVTIQIFHTGKVTVMGAKTKADAKEAFGKIYPVLKVNERLRPSA